MRAGAKFDPAADFVSDRVWVSALLLRDIICRGFIISDKIISLKYSFEQ